MGIYYAMANLSCGVICLVLALVFQFNKNAANLIAGYNTLPEEEKTKYNVKELCRFISKLTFFWATLMIVTGIVISMNFAIWVMLICSWGIFIVTLVSSLIYRSQSMRFKA